MKIRSRIVTPEQEVQRAKDQAKSSRHESSVAAEQHRRKGDDNTVHFSTAKEILQQDADRAARIEELKAEYAAGTLKAVDSRILAEKISEHVDEEIEQDNILEKIFKQAG